MISVPQAFFDNPQIDVVLRRGRNCILRKETSAVNENNDRYLAAHAVTAVHSGELLVDSQEGGRFRVASSQMILLPRGMYAVTDIIPADRPFSATVFFFDDELLESFLESRMEQITASALPSMPCGVFEFTPVYQQFLDGLMNLRDSYRHREITNLKLLEFLHLVGGSQEADTFLSHLSALRNRQQKSVQAFMEEHYDKPLGIEDYAYLTGRSISTFHRDFKRQFGMAPKSWLVGKRLQRAHDRLLEQPGISVTQLAFESGYDNVSYFIKAFQKQFHISPKQLQIKFRNHSTV